MILFPVNLKYRHFTSDNFTLLLCYFHQMLPPDIDSYFSKLAPADDKYLHNDLHLRDVPPDEPENAHSHLIAMMLGNSETLAIVEGAAVLGTYQSLMALELDGPRERKISIQVMGQ